MVIDYLLVGYRFHCNRKSFFKSTVLQKTNGFFLQECCKKTECIIITYCVSFSMSVQNVLTKVLFSINLCNFYSFHIVPLPNGVENGRALQTASLSLGIEIAVFSLI